MRHHDELDEAFRLLAAADVVAFGGVGFAGAILPVTEAYRRVEAAGAAARERVEALLAKGTPAGRAYAAALLDRIDPAAGREAWRALSGAREPVETFAGCIRGTEPLADYAAARLAPPPE